MRSVSAVLMILLVTPAAAHPSDHAGLTTDELMRHLTEPDHLALLVLTIVIGGVAYRAWRRGASTKPRKELP